MRKLVLLDAAGVLLRENDNEFFTFVAHHNDLDVGRVNEWFDVVAYEPWWSGAWDWNELWVRFSEEFGDIDTTDYEEKWVEGGWRFSSIERVKLWSVLADVILVSDHRSEWITLALADIKPLFIEWFVSSEIGATKRSSSFWEIVSKSTENYNTIIYLDDQQTVLDYAKTHLPTIQTYRADPAGKWMTTVDRFIAGGVWSTMPSEDTF